MGITSPFFTMFGRSPIQPLQNHMEKSCACAEQLLPFFKAVLAEDWKEATKIQLSISKLEDEADELKKNMRLHLPSSLFSPIARTDLLELLQSQDGLANLAQDIAGIVIGRQMKIPTLFRDDYFSFLNRCIEASKQAKEAINELDELLNTGFRGDELELIAKMIVKLDEIEHDTDEQQIKIRAKLFSIERELPPIDVIFLYTLIEQTGDLADLAHHIGARLQILIAR